MDRNYAFSNKLTELRTGKGLTQLELSMELGVCEKTISRWENGQALEKIKQFAHMEEFFDISLRDIYRNTDIESEE